MVYRQAHLGTEKIPTRLWKKEDRARLATDKIRANIETERVSGKIRPWARIGDRRWTGQSRGGWCARRLESHLTHPPSHLWRDKWTTLSGPLSLWASTRNLNPGSRIPEPGSLNPDP